MKRWMGVLFTSFIFLVLSFGLGNIAYGQEEYTLDQFYQWLEKYKNAQPEFKLGDVITYEERDKLKPFIFPGAWKIYFFPGMQLKIDETRDYSPHSTYLEATKKFANQAKLDQNGMLTNFRAGMPFTREQIEAAEPDTAGMMLAWNFEYRWQGQGLYCHWGADLLRLGGGVDRTIEGYYQRLYFTGRGDLPQFNYTLPGKDSSQFLYKEWTSMISPYDIKDTTFDIFRYADPYKADDAWAYIPALRRVRRLSMASRADAFMGTDWTLDDFWIHAGRPIDWKWKLLGKKKMLVMACTKRRHDTTFEGPNKWVAELKYNRWELKDIYIVELTPVWTRHPYGKKILGQYAENMFLGPFSAYDRKGDLWKYAQFTYVWSGENTGAWQPGNEGLRILSYASLQVWDLQNDKGTLFYLGKENITHRRWDDNKLEIVQEIHNFFDINRLTRGR